MRQNARLEALLSLGYNSGLNCKKYSENGPVAQSVEQRIENPCVGGSIPPWATSFLNANLLRLAFSFLSVDNINTTQQDTY
jgi:hypothetical protein